MSEPLPPTSFIAPEVAFLAPLFPGYEIESLIATGGMGAVYCATQRSLDRTVALKILPPELSRDAAFRADFETEAKAIARLNHPNFIGRIQLRFTAKPQRSRRDAKLRIRVPKYPQFNTITLFLCDFATSTSPR